MICGEVPSAESVSTALESNSIASCISNLTTLYAPGHFFTP